MSYDAGQLIRASDYNTFSNQLAAIAGPSTGTMGWGQSTAPYANVAASNTVTATQWTGLIQKMQAAYTHQNNYVYGNGTLPTSVTAGSTITAMGWITSGLNNMYGDAQNGKILTPRSDSAATNATYNGGWGTTGNRGLQFWHTVTFPSADAARYFFNAGGQLKLSFSRSGGSATSRNSEWSQLAADCGTRVFEWKRTYRAGGGGAAPTTYTAGYWNTGTTNIPQMLQYDSGGSYSNNYIITYAYEGGAASNGGYQTIVFNSYWINSWANGWQDWVDGSATTSLVVSYPSTTYIANTWGTPSVTTSASLY